MVPRSDHSDTWLWINTYENTIFRGMNIHKSQLFWCELQGYYWFWSIATWILHGFASWLWRLCLSDSSRPAGWVRRSLLLSQAPSITYSVSRAAEVNYIHYTDYTVYMIYMMYWGKFTHESSCAPQQLVFYRFLISLRIAWFQNPQGSRLDGNPRSKTVPLGGSGFRLRMTRRSNIHPSIYNVVPPSYVRWFKKTH